MKMKNKEGIMEWLIGTVDNQPFFIADGACHWLWNRCKVFIVKGKKIFQLSKDGNGRFYGTQVFKSLRVNSTLPRFYTASELEKYIKDEGRN